MMATLARRSLRQSVIVQRPFSSAPVSEKTIEIIKATTPLVAENALLITSTFYSNMFRRNPEVKHFFNKSHQRTQEQPKALSHAIKAFAGHITDIETIQNHLKNTAHRHVALAVKPEHYAIVHENMMLSIGDVLGDVVTPEIGAAWSEAVMALAGILIKQEEALYQNLEQRKGGWKYEREFKLVKKTKVADDVVAFDFAPTDGYSGGFDFDAGQYLTFRATQVVGASVTPRHYTVTSPIGSSTLQCATRADESGFTARYMHDTMEIGELCLLAAPCGVFTAKDLDGDKHVLVSAGIGVTTAKAHLDAHKDKIVKTVHVERNQGRHAYHAYFQESGVNCSSIYTDSAGRPDLGSLAKELVDEAGTDAVYRVCCPPKMMGDIKTELNKLGAMNVQTEKYGTGLVEK